MGNNIWGAVQAIAVQHKSTLHETHKYDHKKETIYGALLSLWGITAGRAKGPKALSAKLLLLRLLNGVKITKLLYWWALGYLFEEKKPPANYTACPLFLNPVLACLSTWVLTLACSYRRKAWELPAAGFCPVSTNQHPPSFHHHRRRWSLYQVFLPQHSTKNKMHHYIKLDTFCSIVL